MTDAARIGDLVNRGFMTVNEARDRMGLGPLDGIAEPLVAVGLDAGRKPAPEPEPWEDWWT